MNTSSPKQEKTQVQPLCLISTKDGSRFELGSETLVGREVECKVLLDSPLISRYHAKLSISERGVLVEDLNSANGTFVNGRRIRDITAVSIGDELCFETQRFRLTSPESGNCDATAMLTRPSPKVAYEQDATIYLQPVTAAKLLVHNPSAAAYEVKLDADKKNWLIGRSAAADIQIDDASISREHARLRLSETGYYIETLSRQRPLLINGVRRSQSELRSGDEIRLGQSQLKLYTNDDARPGAREKRSELSAGISWLLTAAISLIAITLLLLFIFAS
ncbi:FHA domain-containing protein [Agaribacterium haliotis]|uniref:FHA domain-containing protein n=1 Tax=Agaribacterium haliotis TaxID=2013869 RepID=UPI000BB557CF|nr:FHA domain-containing protein [Agaribacterium haliotis]